RGDRLEDGVAVADVEGGMVGSDDVVAGAGLDDLASDLTGRAGDEDPRHVAERVVMTSTRRTPRRRAPAPAVAPTSRDARRTTRPSRRGRDRTGSAAPSRARAGSSSSRGCTGGRGRAGRG